MKKLLYTGAALSVIAIITYFNLTNIANWWVAKKDAQAQQELKKGQAIDTLPYFKNEYIVMMPKNPDSAKALATLLERKGLFPKNCNCSSSIQLWSADPNLAEIMVDLEPDHDPPPPTGSQFRRLDTLRKIKIDIPPPFAKKKDYIIARNYKLVEPMNFSRVIRPLEANTKRLPQHQANVPIVTVATIDSGVDPTVPAVNGSLFRNASGTNICSPPFFEGVYGWNALNTSNDFEPIDTDEKCYGIFSVRVGHGTLINGIIAGSGSFPNQTDFKNDVNVNIKLLNVRFDDQRENKGSLFKAICGINYALDKGAKVINVSWRLPVVGIDSPSAKAIFSATLTRLKDEKAILVACAGNDTLKSNPNLRIWPAAFSRDFEFSNNVIAVGGWNSIPPTAATQNIAPTSNVASFVDVYAPSMEIRMYNRITDLPFWRCPFIFDRAESGTSFATAFITREVAILMGNLGNSIPPDAAQIIKSQIISRGTATNSLIHAPPPPTM
jgi:hypothetical protein